MWGGGQFSNLFYQRSIYYEAPGEADGPRRLSEMEQPLHLSPRGIELSEQPPPSYVHPKGATPAITSLAIAYRRCAQSEANRIHGGGLAFTSCNPATPTSQSLTVGTPGANGARSNASGFVRLDVCPVPGCAAPDVRIQVGMNDVRCRPGTAPCPATNAVAGPDYGGELELMLPLRITDGWNGLPAGGEGSDAATVADLPFTAAIGCTPTADTDRGAACAVTTTANTLVPGAFRSGARANTELGQIEVHDGGADGAVATADNQLFAVQGIFVP
jgi:hypothetical protein